MTDLYIKMCVTPLSIKTFFCVAYYLTRLTNYQGSVTVLLAEQDEVVPNQRTMALLDGLPGLKKLWRFENAGPNSLPLVAGRPWRAEIMHFLDH